MFSLFLGIAAFSVDQGIWLGERRISQKDADLSSLAGASVFTEQDYPDGQAAAEARAEEWAVNNLSDVGAALTDFRALGDCTTYDGTVYPVPSVEVDINAPTGGLFSSLFGLGGIEDLGATATACVGSPSSVEGIDPFYVAPDVDRPDPPCFDEEGDPRLGTICAIMGPSHFHEVGQRGSLTLQDNPSNPVGQQTICTEAPTSQQSQQIVAGSQAICGVGDEVNTDGGTLQNVDMAIQCRIVGWEELRAQGDGNFCPSGFRSAAKSPGEGFCDADFHVDGTELPPYHTELEPPFDTADVIDSPAGLDDFVEVFSKADGSSPDSLTGTEFLRPNVCNNGVKSPRVFIVVLAEEPAGQMNTCVNISANGCVIVEQFAMFYVIGCRDVADPSSFTFVGVIDPYCANINASTTALIGIFVKALLPRGGGSLSDCRETGVVGCSVVLVK